MNTKKPTQVRKMATADVKLTKKNLKSMRKEGLTYKAIARKLHMSVSGLYYYYWKWNLR